MKVAVIGRNGQIAAALIRRLEASPGHQAVIGARPEVDLRQPGSAAAFVRAVAPDAVVNLAAYTAVDRAEDEPDAAFRVNGEAAGEIAAAAAAVGSPLIHLSTDYVFDGKSSRPYLEDDAPNPLNVYGQSKLMGEERVREACADHLILRTAWVYDATGQNFVRTMLRLAQSNDEVRVVDDQFGSPTSADFIAEMIIHLLPSLSDRFGTYHLVAAGEVSWYGFAERIFAGAERRGLPVARVEPVSSAEWPARAERPRHSVLATDKFQRTLGIELPRWEALLDTVLDEIADRELGQPTPRTIAKEF